MDVINYKLLTRKVAPLWGATLQVWVIYFVQLLKSYRTYAKNAKTLTPSPSPFLGEGNKKNLLLPFSRSGRRGWGMRAIWILRKS
jgi:hypothetical protein